MGWGGDRADGEEVGTYPPPLHKKVGMPMKIGLYLLMLDFDARKNRVIPSYASFLGPQNLLILALFSGHFPLFPYKSGKIS